MPGADEYHELHSSTSHHERTYPLSSQECQEQMNTISFIPAPATTREIAGLTTCGVIFYYNYSSTVNGLSSWLIPSNTHMAPMVLISFHQSLPDVAIILLTPVCGNHFAIPFCIRMHSSSDTCNDLWHTLLMNLMTSLQYQSCQMNKRVKRLRN
jgi:hypothetical protein